MSYKLVKLILAIASLVLIIAAFGVMFLNAIELEIRQYSVSYTYNMTTSRGEYNKVLFESYQYKATGMNLASGGNHFASSFGCMFSIILFIVAAILVILKFGLSFSEKTENIGAYIGLACALVAVVAGIIVWFTPAFAEISNGTKNTINTLYDNKYSIIVEKHRTPTIFISGLLSILGGVCIYLSTVLRYD